MQYRIGENPVEMIIFVDFGPQLALIDMFDVQCQLYKIDKPDFSIVFQNSRDKKNAVAIATSFNLVSANYFYPSNSHF